MDAGAPLNSGVHAGAVMRDRDGDIHGSTVNLAARLQRMAEDLQIVASETVVQALPRTIRREAFGVHSFDDQEDAMPCFLIEPETTSAK